MLKIKTIVKESNILNAGLGLFANEFIPKGAIIWEMTPCFDLIFNKLEIEMLEEIQKKYFYKYCFVLGGLYYFCCDDAKYFNHSETPNCDDPKDKNITIANRDIEIGEELTSDYRIMCENGLDFIC